MRAHRSDLKQIKAGYKHIWDKNFLICSRLWSNLWFIGREKRRDLCSVPNSNVIIY